MGTGSNSTSSSLLLLSSSFPSSPQMAKFRRQTSIHVNVPEVADVYRNSSLFDEMVANIEDSIQAGRGTVRRRSSGSSSSSSSGNSSSIPPFSMRWWLTSKTVSRPEGPR